HEQELDDARLGERHEGGDPAASRRVGAKKRHRGPGHVHRRLGRWPGVPQSRPRTYDGRPMRPRSISAEAYRRVTFLALVAVGVIIVTGGAVRLTGSGLGCPDWPTCSRGTLVAATSAHRAIESINRTLTGLVS